ncbi:CDK5RAP2 family protein [Megaselia abdita]
MDFESIPEETITVVQDYNDTEIASPGQLQDVTMDTYGMAFTSPSSAPHFGSSPASNQGCSVREQDEKMAALRKENFNLKLRIYFLEEKMPNFNQINSPEGQEDLMKQHINSKIEIEVLKKELQEKQDLIVNAAKAIDQMDLVQKEAENRFEGVIEELNQKITFLEMENKELERSQKTVASAGTQLLENFKFPESGDEFASTNRLQELEDNLKEVTSQIKELEAQLKDKTNHIEELNNKVQSLQYEKQELREQLENKSQDIASYETKKLQEELQEHRMQIADHLCTIDDLEEKLKKKSVDYEKSKSYVVKLAQTVQSYQNNTNASAFKENSNVNSKDGSSLSSTFGRSVSDSESVICIGEIKNKYEEIIDNNKRKIKRLESEIADLKRGMESRKDDGFIYTLQKELKESKEYAQKADSWRMECKDVCMLLTTRLEELAGFLDCLLKHKEVLSVLGHDRRKVMRKAVDKSLDLSRSLNPTMSTSFSMTSNFSVNEISFPHFTNITGLLDSSKFCKTFNSHEDQDEVEDAHKERVLESKPKKGHRKSLELENQSESEAWSEPDRLVSIARIGLEEPSSLKTPVKQKEHDSADTEDGLDSRRGKSKTLEKINSLEEMISTRDNKLLEVQCELVDADNRLKKENMRIMELTRELDNLRSVNDVLQSENNELKTQCQKHNQFTVECSYLKKQLDERNTILEKLQEEREKLRVEVKVAEIQIKAQEENYSRELTHIKNTSQEEMRLAKEQFIQQIKENEIKLKDSMEKDWVARNLYEQLQKEYNEMEKKLIDALESVSFLQDNEKELENHLVENEKAMRVLKKNLDEATLQASKTIQDRSKALTDKLRLEETVQELNKQIYLLTEEKQKLEQMKTLNTAPRLSDDFNSGYTSEEVAGRADGHTSPDLGIESDPGKRLMHTDSKEELHKILSDLPMDGDVKPLQHSSIAVSHDCAKVEAEVAELRRKLFKNKRQFEQVVAKLKIDNQRKEQLEKDIKNQILKTHNVLKNARSNIENEFK